MVTPPTPPAPLPAPPRPPRGPWILFGALGVVAVAIVIAIPLLVPGVGFGVVSHEVCTLGPTVESVVFWTPVVMLNSPYMGSAWANGSGSSINATNGQAVGVFRTLDWHLVRLENTSAAGPGISTPCITGYSATYTVPTPHASTTEGLLPLGSTADVREATSFTADGNASVLFDNTAYTVSSGGVQIGDCVSRVAAEENATSGVYPITVPFPGADRSHYVSVLFAESVTYTYAFRLGGRWTVNFAETAPSGADEGGWSFTYFECTQVPPPGPLYP